MSHRKKLKHKAEIFTLPCKLDSLQWCLFLLNGTTHCPHQNTGQYPIFLLTLTSSDIQAFENSLIPAKNCYNLFLSMCALAYSKPPSSFLNYCKNLLTSFFVAPFHQSFLITTIRSFLLWSLFYSELTWLLTAFSICSKLINMFRWLVWRSSYSLLYATPSVYTPAIRKPVSSSVSLYSPGPFLSGIFPLRLIPIS